MGTVALSNRTQLFVSSHLLLAANACSASLSPQSLAQGPKPTVSVLAHCLLDALGTVARYATAPIASSLISHALGTVARYATAPIASSLISLALGTVAC